MPTLRIAVRKFDPFESALRHQLADFPRAWSPSLLGLQSFAGGFWGLPYHDGPACLIYRKDWLAQAGLEVPRTWKDFHAAARRAGRAVDRPAWRTMAGHSVGGGWFPDAFIGTMSNCSASLLGKMRF